MSSSGSILRHCLCLVPRAPHLARLDLSEPDRRGAARPWLPSSSREDAQLEQPARDGECRLLESSSILAHEPELGGPLPEHGSERPPPVEERDQAGGVLVETDPEC